MLESGGCVAPPNHFCQEVTGDPFQAQTSYYKEQTSLPSPEDPQPPATSFVF